MGLGLNYSSGEGGGDITPFCKFDARAGRLFRVDRTNDGQGFANTPVDITRAFKAVFDMDHVEVGYMNFSTGGAPDFVLVPLGSIMPQRPSPNHKQGARLMMKLGADCGADVREMSSSATAFLRGLDELHTAYEAGKAANPGKLPVVTLKDTVGITSGQGDKKSTNYQPVFEIVGWVNRPPDLVFKPRAGGAGSAAAPSQRPTIPLTGPGAPDFIEYRRGYTPPSTGSTQVAAPVSAPAAAMPPPAAQQQAADELASEFG